MNLQEMTDEELVKELKYSISHNCFERNSWDDAIADELFTRLERGRKAVEKIKEIEQRAASNLNDRETVHAVWRLASDFNRNYEATK